MRHRWGSCPLDSTRAQTTLNRTASIRAVRTNISRFPAGNHLQCRPHADRCRLQPSRPANPRSRKTQQENMFHGKASPLLYRWTFVIVITTEIWHAPVQDVLEATGTTDVIFLYLILAWQTKIRWIRKFLFASLPSKNNPIKSWFIKVKFLYSSISEYLQHFAQEWNCQLVITVIIWIKRDKIHIQNHHASFALRNRATDSLPETLSIVTRIWQMVQMSWTWFIMIVDDINYPPFSFVKKSGYYDRSKTARTEKTLQFVQSFPQKKYLFTGIAFNALSSQRFSPYPTRSNASKTTHKCIIKIQITIMQHHK